VKTTDIALIEQYETPSNLEARILLHERFSVNEQRWPLWVFDQFEIPLHCQILDLGCGLFVARKAFE
jgi:hypothetical protein